MSTTASSSTPSTSRQTKISTWIPISAFIGTSLALAIPLYMLHRQRIGKTTLRTSFKFSQTASPPPRRSSTTLPSLRGSSTTPAPLSSPTSNPALGATSEPSDGTSSPGMRELISAISQVNQSTALLAAKAFLIATGLVAVGGVTFTWAVKETLGVADAKEFGQKMRTILQSTVPSLRSRLYRPPETDDELYQVPPPPNASSENWNWAEAEERLKKAYDQGGITVWAHTALKELEAEALVERNKRDREQEVASGSGSGKKDLSLN